ncbi:MAG: acyltransferase [Devosia sp.]|uniref:acyltransferase family protein n=1 Tax=Devosia sp. TaxID=1871048 RepID=UPI0024CA282D|nr:acyltransferase [Devosia sp.]UYN99673.1 MAG: acyltransferase [Devosia sp.]
MRSKLHTIQYLRAFAAMLVLASHALLYPLADHPLVYGRMGQLGVVLFFVLSGFIMVVVTGHSRFDARDFLRRRVVRVVPMYWAFTFLAAALALVLPSLFKTTVFDGMQLALSLVFVPFYNPASHGLHPLYKLGWTLNYEMFFYVSFALLALLPARARVMTLSVVFGGLALIGAVLRPTEAIPAFYTSYMPLAFVAGAWLGLGHIEGRLQTLGRPLALVAGALVLAGLAQGFAVAAEEHAFWGMLVFAVALVAMAIAFAQNLPQWPLLELVGDASYSIYLVHIFAVAAIAGVALHLVEPAGTTATLVAVGAAIVGGTLIGVMLYRLVEAPLMRRMRKPA